MADCQRCPTDVVEMANSLIAHNKQRDNRQLKPLPDKGPGEVEIVQLLDSDIEAKWIAQRAKALFEKGVQPHEIIVLVQRKKGAPAVVDALKNAGLPAKSYYEESQLESEDAQMHFAVFKLFLNRDDRVALRYLVGVSSHNFYAGAYARLRAHCESTGDTPFEALEKLSDGTLTLPRTKPMVKQFGKITKALNELEPFREDVAELVEKLFPDEQPSIKDLRELALSAKDDAHDASELFGLMMKEITQPDIPPEVKEVRVMSLNKSKGLSSPYVFIAQCVQGVLPKIQKDGTPQILVDAHLEEARRLFFVGITRVKSGGGRPGSLFLTYPRQMGANTARGLGIPFAKSVNGRAQLSPSMFIQELGPKAPAPIAGKL
jgi:DNA helicase II / ATP-dependent DNA helicase PcrA